MSSGASYFAKRKRWGEEAAAGRVPQGVLGHLAADLDLVLLLSYSSSLGVSACLRACLTLSAQLRLSKACVHLNSGIWFQWAGLASG